MRQLVTYQTGESRVIDAETMTASGFLHHSEMDAPLEDYELDCELSDADLNAEYRIVR